MMPEQILLLKKYYGIINCDNFKSIKTTGLLMLVGLPCSGKSTFALELTKKFTNTIHINQDELGKANSEELLSR